MHYRHPCKSIVKLKARSGLSRSRERVVDRQDLSLRTLASRLMVPASSRTGHPFAASGYEEPSQKIEFVFSASPETNRREPPELPPCSGDNVRDLAVCASIDPDVFSLLGKVLQAAALSFSFVDCG
jgi:hypothetical protein